MRIISGNLKGSKLYITKDNTTRPLKDLVRESVFNLLTHSNKITFKIEQSNILDLYAGTGSFGLECLSRKAKNVFFVENGMSAFKILEKNIEKLKLKKKAKIFFNDVVSSIKEKKFSELKFDLVFSDPPFKNMDINQLIGSIFDSNLLNKNGIIILHRNKTTKEKLPDCLKIFDERIYGISKIIFGKFSS